MRSSCLACALVLLTPPASVLGQAADRASVVDYVVGAQDVLTITSYDQADLSGKFTVETDGTFTYPLIGRFKAGGLTLRAVEDGLKKRLTDEGYFKHPQITVTIETYRSRKLFIIGEVRNPGTYPLSGNMNLVEAIARAGSTLPSASGEAVIVHAGENATGPTMPQGENAKELDVIRINLRQLENGELSQNAALSDGDTIFVPRAQSIYVTGQVKNAAAYTLQQQNTTVLQALAMAGGVTDRGATNRITITRIVDGVKKEIHGVKLTDIVLPNDTITVPSRFF
jgi:polysaccharide biosynthesis/export protein